MAFAPRGRAVAKLVAEHDVRSGSLADICDFNRDVRFVPETDSLRKFWMDFRYARLRKPWVFPMSRPRPSPPLCTTAAVLRTFLGESPPRAPVSQPKKVSRSRLPLPLRRSSAPLWRIWDLGSC